MTGNKCSQESLNIENKQSIPSVHTNKLQTKDKLNKQPLIKHSKIAHSVNEKRFPQNSTHSLLNPLSTPTNLEILTIDFRWLV